MNVDKEFLNFRINYSLVSINPKVSKEHLQEFHEELAKLFESIPDYPLFLEKNPKSFICSSPMGRIVGLGVVYDFKRAFTYLEYSPVLIKEDSTFWTLTKVYVEYSYAEKKNFITLVLFNDMCYKQVERMSISTFIGFLNEVKEYLGDEMKL